MVVERHEIVQPPFPAAMSAHHGEGSGRLTKCMEGSASRYKRGAITRGLDFDAEAVAPTIVVMLTFR